MSSIPPVGKAIFQPPSGVLIIHSEHIPNKDFKKNDDDGCAIFSN
jgi:hypothetical protein